MIWGIDFGARLSGNTVIAAFQSDCVQLMQCPMSVDANAWISEKYREQQPELIAIDAPLSLPFGYFRDKGDLHFREADRALAAMSPMFIGGLTARAIEWTRELSCEVIEAYPSALADLWTFQGRKKRKEDVTGFFNRCVKPRFREQTGIRKSYDEPVNIHQLDAWLALMTAMRYQNGEARSYGNKEEGLIWV